MKHNKKTTIKRIVRSITPWISWVVLPVISALTLMYLLITPEKSLSSGGSTVSNTSDVCTTTTPITILTTVETLSTTTTTNSTTSLVLTTTTTNIVTTIINNTTTQNKTENIESYKEETYSNSQNLAYSESDIILLAKLINHEASASYEGKIAVGSCVVNRMNYFNETVSGVIFMPNQFTTADELRHYNTDDYNAALQVLTQGSINTRIFYFDGCHPDRKNWFYDIHYNYLGAY